MTRASMREPFSGASRRDSEAIGGPAGGGFRRSRWQVALRNHLAMVANRDLNGALRRRAQKLGIDIIEGVAVSAFDTNGAGVTVHLADGATLKARLLVAADGVNSKLRDMIVWQR